MCRLKKIIWLLLGFLIACYLFGGGKIEEMFKTVRNKVSELSKTQYGEEQLSWEYSSLIGDFYFSNLRPYIFYRNHLLCLYTWCS